MKNSSAILIILSGIFNALGQFFWKLSNAQINFCMFIGFLFFGIGGVLMVLGFKNGELSNLHSLMGISYIIAFLLSIFYFGEMFTIRQLIGCLMILIGVIRLGFGGCKNNA